MARGPFGPTRIATSLCHGDAVLRGIRTKDGAGKGRGLNGCFGRTQSREGGDDKQKTCLDWLAASAHGEFRVEGRRPSRHAACLLMIFSCVGAPMSYVLCRCRSFGFSAEFRRKSETSDRLSSRREIPARLSFAYVAVSLRPVIGQEPRMIVTPAAQCDEFIGRASRLIATPPVRSGNPALD